MKKKGFTLMELLGVIVILGVLVLIMFPPILNQIKKSKQEIRNSTKTLIIDAAKDYYEDNINNYKKMEGMTYCININTLTSEGYLNSKIKDENISDLSNTKIIKMTYHNEKFDYDVVNSCAKYTVTFDPNGGTVDVQSKEVTQDSVYGELPTPTREGYTFVGWNGNNMLNMKEWLNSFSASSRCSIEKSENSITLNATENDAYTHSYNSPVTQSNFGYSPMRINVYPNRKYTISWKSDSDKNGKVYVFVNDKQATNYMFSANNSTKKLSFNTPSDAQFIYFRVGVANKGESIKYYNIQLEQGETATPYEPYYITPTTKVVQQKNHTLKAIWQAN